MRGRTRFRDIKAQAAHVLADAHKLEVKADTTLDQGQEALKEIRKDLHELKTLAALLIVTVTEFMEDVADGVKLETTGEALWKGEPLPLSAKFTVMLDPKADAPDALIPPL